MKKIACILALLLGFAAEANACNPALVTSFGVRSNVLLVPTVSNFQTFGFGFSTFNAVPFGVGVGSANVTVVNNNRGLFGLRRNQQVIQASAGMGGANATVINNRRRR